MRLNNYLLTEGRTENIRDEDALKLLGTTHSVAAKSSSKALKRIYRGLQNVDYIFGFVRPSEHTRLSKNTINAYTLLIDNLSQWKEYPKRSKSIICSTDYGRAKDYSHEGGPYIIFPKNGAKIGVCSTWDIWDSFNIKVGDMSGFNNQLRNLLLVAFDTNDIYMEEFKNWKSFLQNLDYLDKHKTEIYQNDPVAMDGIIRDLELDKYFKNKNMKLIDHLGDLLDPNKNGFDLKKVGDDLPAGSEVWTDADCILIQYEYFMHNLIGKL